MGYAEVSVNSPAANRRTFSYAIPAGLNIAVGQAVWVPFGNKLLQGIVLELTDYPSVTETREISGTIYPYPLVSQIHITLARWISQHYLSPLFDTLSLMLPPGFKRKSLTCVSLTPEAHRYGTPSDIGEDGKKLLEAVREKGTMDLREVEKLLGSRTARLTITRLIHHKLLTKLYRLEPVRVRPKEVRCVDLLISRSEAVREAERLQNNARTTAQASMLEILSRSKLPLPVKETCKMANCSPSVIRSLARKGLASTYDVEVKRRPSYNYHFTPSQPLSLTDQQKAALAVIRASLLDTRKEHKKEKIFLLQGVTASGKTEVYLQSLAEVKKQGKKAIVLVPEIALTPQTIERFAARFPRRLAVLHSGLSAGERFDEWRRISNGEVDVVIGSRSAIFSPQPDLGLIVIDEEHEWTYKQNDTPPRYHARDVAKKLAELNGATVILGSATPDVESFYHARNGDYHLIELPERVVPLKGSPPPEVEIVDLRDELKSGNRSIFSRSLYQAILDAIENKKQAIMFLNRRGGATFVQCRNCGFVVRCPRCAVALTFHPSTNTLSCHRCNYHKPVPHTCPHCASSRIKFLGTGTEKLEQEARMSFPRARLLRWDSDTVRKKKAHQEILDLFRSHQADILIGTQMIAKGLHLPLVTVVGIISADLSLNFPDFRAGERTFQLLSQVIGRAGRGDGGGRVIIQTYCPENYAIQAASRHDYDLFYQQEIAYRRRLHNPPFSRLACLTFSHSSENTCQEEASRMKRLLQEEIDRRGIDNLSLIGPAPAFVHKLRGRFRWQLILRGADLAAFLSEIPLPKGWVIDIDPIGIS